ncbi:hypothetical protein [uncultured Roseobacter sp.]|uniref:hypothetical protein n=1 Tax=uncultured Roseobacter sp. TaxID=114847 RepID=UPI002632FF4D|nr:hypothetical protein [uncultured Roseobacter sp.]
MQYLQSRAPEHPKYNPVARVYKNSVGADVLIHLPQGYWTFVDWAEARDEIDFQYWVIHTEQHPYEDWSLSQLLMYWLWLDQCRRHRYGHATHTNVPPEGYETYGEGANDG